MIRIAPSVIAAVWLLSSASCHDLQSPCPDIFAYEPNIEESFSKRWFGVITLRTTEPLHGLWIDVILTSKADSLGNWYGSVTSGDNIEFSIQNPNYMLDAGKQVQIRVFAQYRDANNIPALRIIRLNGREICSGGSTPTRVAAPPSSYSETTIPPNPSFTRTRTKDKTAWTQQCYNEINPLVTVGKKTKDGEWPWHVAIYHNEHEGSSSTISYKCGGSLISDSHVLTAAHCVFNKQTRALVEIRSINIYMGTRFIKTFSVTVQLRLVDKLDIHPEYNAQTQYKDIALLRLDRPAELTGTVRPVCLWPEDKVDLNTVTGQNGSVVGWGYDEYGLLAEELMLAELPVVSQQMCLWSHRFYQAYTNNFTFCAGLLRGTSVCNGDSGGGMVFKLPTSSGREEWFLRGIVSFSPATGNTQLCDPSRYAIFTDVAQYLGWIKDLVTRDM